MQYHTDLLELAALYYIHLNNYQAIEQYINRTASFLFCIIYIYLT